MKKLYHKDLVVIPSKSGDNLWEAMTSWLGESCKILLTTWFPLYQGRWKSPDPRLTQRGKLPQRFLCFNNVSYAVASQSHPFSHITAHIVLIRETTGEASAVYLVLTASLTAGSYSVLSSSL